MFFSNIKFVLFGLVLTIVIALGCIHLGDWQLNKAHIKQQLQTQMDERLQKQFVDLPNDFSQPETLRYLRVKVKGTYLPDSQRYLDNQVYQDQAGFHVLTPFLIKDSAKIILVNRGWVLKDFNQQTPLQVDTPEGEQTLEGYLWLPPSKTYQLSNSSVNAQTSVLEVLNLTELSKQLNLSLLPVILRLQQPEPLSQLVVDWPRPDDRIATHLSYAYQWYGFAVSAVLIFIVVAWRRRWKS